MRSVKRPRRPVHRYKSLLFPGIALLAVFGFWSAFAAPEQPAGETALFEYGGLKIEITNVREVEQDICNDGGPEFWEYPVYTVYPGAVATVRDADMLEDSPPSPRWFFHLEPLETGGRRLDVTDGMEPVELTPEVVGITDGDAGVWLARFEVLERNN